MTTRLSRRAFVKIVGLSALYATLPAGISRARPLANGAREWIARGHTTPELVSFDNTMRDFMQARDIPGGALAVTCNSRLVLARGYTWSNDSEDIVVEPTSLFRIASLTKPITAAAVLRQVQDNQLDLSAKLTDILTSIHHRVRPLTHA